jgi:small-conductance mechanosensitive channel
LDGSILIIPNGDLLSQHLINWSKGKNVRKITSKVSVVMGTDIEKVKSIALDIIKADERVMTYPVPTVGIKEFANGAIDFDISYWIKHIKESNNVNADVLEQLTKSFDEAGIRFAHTQQEIAILSIPDNQNKNHGNTQ